MWKIKINLQTTQIKQTHKVVCSCTLVQSFWSVSGDQFQHKPKQASYKQNYPDEHGHLTWPLNSRLNYISSYNQVPRCALKTILDHIWMYNWIKVKHLYSDWLRETMRALLMTVLDGPLIIYTMIKHDDCFHFFFTDILYIAWHTTWETQYWLILPSYADPVQQDWSPTPALMKTPRQGASQNKNDPMVKSKLESRCCLR